MTYASSHKVSEAYLVQIFSMTHPFIRRTRYEKDNHGHMWYCFHRKCALHHKNHRSFDSHKAVLDHIIHCHHHELHQQLNVQDKCCRVQTPPPSLIFRLQAKSHPPKTSHKPISRRPLIDRIKSTQMIHRHMRWKI